MSKNVTVPAVSLLAVTLLSPAAIAQSNVDPNNKFSWSENCGYMNWADAGSPAGMQAAVFSGTFASGFVWMENTGWLNLGDGSPVNGTAYANVNGSDFGVNILASGALAGYAWGENIGWVNFTLPSLPPAQQPRLDTGASRLRGYAWGENVGWINLDSIVPGKFVAISVPCPADFNQDGVLNSDDLSDFITGYFNQPPDARTDFNADGVINSDDLSDFITAYFNGC